MSETLLQGGVYHSFFLSHTYPSTASAESLIGRGFFFPKKITVGITVMRGKFKKGLDSRRAKGGARENSGRKPDWLKEQIDKIVDWKALFERCASIAHGEGMEQIVTDQGETVQVPAPVKDQLRAFEILLDRRWGKVPQSLEHSGPEGEAITVKVINYGNNPAI